MADNRMKDDELNRGMGSTGRDKEDYGKQTPGRNPDDQRAGQTGGQQGGRDRTNLDDDEMGGTSSQHGGQNRGGQNR